MEMYTLSAVVRGKSLKTKTYFSRGAVNSAIDEIAEKYNVQVDTIARDGEFETYKFVEPRTWATICYA